MSPDETIALPGPRDENKDVFAIGDATRFALRTQSFEVDDLGTMIVREVSLPQVPPMMVTSASEVDADPIRRLEQKLDAALHLIGRLQQRLDSIDATLARAINR